ncbi:MAG: glucose-1-phosphate adenylyltransferase [Balneolales bacterium]
MMESTIAVILGGGRGTRLEPLTSKRSKPAVPIGGKYRLVDIPISNCMHSDIKRIFVLTQYNSASLNRHIKNTYQFDLFSSGFVDVLAAEQTPYSQHWFQGTADAVRQTFHHMEDEPCDYVMILSGDQLYQMDFTKLMKEHEQNGSGLTVATIPVAADEATDFGIMKNDADGIIRSFIEKPGKDVLADWKSEVSDDLRNEGREYLASMGIYVFNKEVLYQLFEDHPEAKDFGKEIIPKAIDSSLKVSSYNYTGYWTDIGTIKSFFEANLALTDELPKFDLYAKDKMIFTRARLLPGSKISGTRLDRAVVAEGSIIEADHIFRSIIGIRSRIGPETTIQESIIMGNDIYASMDELVSKHDIPPIGIGRRCHIQKAIVDKNSRIGNDVRITGGDHLENEVNENYSIVDGVVIVIKGGIIKDGTVIGGD